MTVAFSCLAACSILVRRQRTAGLGLLVLVAELAGLSSMGLVPFDAPRVMLFLLTIASVQAAAALGSAAGWLWSRRWLWPLVPIGLGLLAYDIAVHREWTTLGRPRQVEGLGPLVTALEKRRGPNDGVLLYYRSTFVHAYYQRDTPVLVPDQGTTVGYRPRIDDPNIVVVTGESAREAAAEVFAGRQRMWFLGSRMAPIEQERIVGGIAASGARLAEMMRGPRAVLQLWLRPPPVKRTSGSVPLVRGQEVRMAARRPRRVISSDCGGL